MTDNTTTAMNAALDLFAQRRRAEAVHGGREFAEGYEETLRETDRKHLMPLVHLGILKPPEEEPTSLAEGDLEAVEDAWMDWRVRERGGRVGRGWQRRVAEVVARDISLLSSGDLLRNPSSGDR